LTAASGLGLRAVEFPIEEVPPLRIALQPVAAVLLLGALSASPAVAQAQVAAPSTTAQSPLAPVYACADETDPAARLACYDAAVAALRGREARSEVVAVDQERLEAVRREAFGFRLPSLPGLFRRGGGAAAPGGGGAASREEQEPELERQSMTVARVTSRGDRTVLVMDNGQIWQFVEAGEITGRRTPPFQVLIRQAALGSFIMSVEGSNRGYRIRRVE
jgi:hypothetical protein